MREDVYNPCDNPLAAVIVAAANSTQRDCGQPTACLSSGALTAVAGGANCSVLGNVTSGALSCWRAPRLFLIEAAPLLVRVRYAIASGVAA